MDRTHREHIEKFMTAALENNLDVIEDMIKQEICGPGVKFIDRQGRTPLHCILSGDNFKNLDDLKRGLWMLKHNGADVNVQDHLSNTPLHLIFETYDVEIPDVVELVLEIFPDYDWTLKDADGYTVFHMFLSNVSQHLEESEQLDAALQSRHDFIMRFLNGNVRGTDAGLITVLLNTKKNSGISAFQSYVDGDCYDMAIVELMIQKEANVNTCSNLGITPLMDAALRQRDDLMHLLLQAGADPNARDIFDQTALFRVRTELSFQYLCDNGADLTVCDRSGKSPLTCYEFFVPQDLPLSGPVLDKNISQYPPLATLLLDKGLDPDATDIYGSSILHYAAWWGDPEIIQLLLAHNATPDVIDGLGMTPYDFAVHHGNYGILNLLATENSQPIDPLCIQTKLRVERYFRIAINEINIDDMDNVLNILNVKDEPEELIPLLFSVPQFEMVSRKQEAVDVVQSVNEVMQRAANAMSTLDKRFRASVKPTGSSSEGTMIGDPCEFDFVFCLDYFSEECVVIQPDSLLGTGFCKLALKQNKDDNHPLKCFERREGFICASDVRHVFQDLLCQALNQCEVWQDIHVYFDGLLEFPDDKPILKLQMGWNGPIYKKITVSVDMVPAMHKTNWFPKEMNKEKLNILSDRVKKVGFFILFHGPELSNDQFDDYTRISSAAMEIEFFKTSPVIFHEIYAICKIMKHQSFCPMAQFNEAMNTDESSSVGDDEMMEKKDEKIKKEEETGKEEEEETAADQEKCCHSYWNIKSKTSTSHSFNVKGVEIDSTPHHIKSESVSNWVAISDPETRKLKSIYVPKKVKHKETDRTTENVVENSTDSSVLYLRQTDCKIMNLADKSNYLKDKKKHTDIARPENSCGAGESSSVHDMQIVKVQIHNYPSQRNFRKRDADVSEDQSSKNWTAQVIECTTMTEEQFDSINNSRQADKIEFPSVDEETDLEGGEVVNADEYITSYMLKNCLLHILHKRKMQSVNCDFSHLSMVREIFTYLLHCSEKRHLNAYCMPFVDIFSYVNEFIRQVDPDKKETELQLLCYK